MCFAFSSSSLTFTEDSLKEKGRKEYHVIPRIRNTYQQVSESDRGRIVANLWCGLSLREIALRTSRKWTTSFQHAQYPLVRVRRRLQQPGMSALLPLQCSIARDDGSGV
ncbi:hypothetical protein TNCV_1777601 [Trichonephila clavipes]|nr:hypothetical protein TNCV_1777601 [Trichonephila clavipes]